MSGKIKVSVVIPCYNVEGYVGDAIRSALSQTHKFGEVICVDDGSTDGTLRILKDLKSKHPQRLVVQTGPNRGGNFARNVGLKLSEGEYIQFLDADDVIDKDKIEHQVSLIDSMNCTVDLVAGGFRYGASNGGSEVRKPGNESDLVNLARTALGRTSSNLWRADSIREVGGWNEDWESSQEYELMFRLLKNGAEICYDRTPKTWIREREGSLTDNDDVSRFRRIVLLRAKILNHARSAGASALQIYKLEQCLFMVVRFLSFRSLSAAVEMHAEYLPEEFTPDSSKFPLYYTIAYNILGYERTEQIRRTIKALTPV
ncbi:glycosyltransferase family 2 protein [Salinibacter ruber]|uniref:glycosyltransferase family 2 protein n=1 Tax=Salinibacter ruber TaxID=146919 RepID=UPI0020743E09|nr:glycosyltransferase family A protein [Salinibacter ruber]